MEKGLMTREIEQESTRWDPFQNSGSFPMLSGILDEIFAQTRLPAPSLPKTWMPRVDIQETEKEYVLTAALPGVRKEDVKLDMHDGMLTITGERRSEKEEKSKAWLRKEISYGVFQRSFILPDGVHPENIKASLKDGVLAISMPKLMLGKSKGVRISIE